MKSFIAVLALLAAALAWAQRRERPVDRTVLPIPEPARPVYTELDARSVQAPPSFAVKAPEGAPNVLIVLIDDVGFGASETFGGPVPMPTLDRLARSGLRYNNFHTTALCSPTRAALKSGRNHHTSRLYHGDGHRFSRQYGEDSEPCRSPRGDAAAQRLQHRRLREVARDGLGDKRLGALRSLADASGLRQVLRLYRWRDEPVGALCL